jgi:prepilin-type N-terminal cleavage/methylation domain-containing protein
MTTNTLNNVLPRVRNRIGFTLIELLIVISIIAILAGLLLPVIYNVRRRGKVATTVLEIQSLKNAIEQYKNKFGDYPPDGSNSVVFERHIRVAFPRIASEEFNDFITLVRDPHESSTTILDPAEALVFFLGGFSDDPRYPFTGKGGPLTSNRNPGMFDFDPTRLSVTASGGSNDETTFETGVNDIFPVYLPKGMDVPFVYFDSRTYMPRYVYRFGNNYVPPAQYPHWHQDGTPNITGIARPYRSDEARQPTPADPYAYKWINPITFQIIAAGVTNDYGDDHFPIPLNNIPTGQTPYKHYPSGQSPNNAPYSDGDKSNITSFSRGTLEDDIP